MPAFRSFANLPISNEGSILARKTASPDRDRPADVARDLHLGIFLSFLLSRRKGAALRRYRGSHQHRAPGFRFKNSRSSAIRNGVAAAAAFADLAVHRVEADVAKRLRRLNSIDGGVCTRRARNIPAGTHSAWP